MNKRKFGFARVLATAGILGLAGMLAACGGGGVTTAPSISFATGAKSVLTAAPGQTLDITLNVTNAAAFTRGIAIVGDRDVGVTAIKKQSPYKYSLTLPSNLQPGTYRLAAMGYASGMEQPLATARVVLQVALPSNALLSLAPPPATLVFEAIGEQLPIRVTGTTSGGAVELTESPDVVYQVSDATVGTVDTRGVVTARAEGEASVALLLNGRTAASAPIEVLKPALLPSAMQLDFGNQAVGSRSAPQTLVITNNRSYPVNILEVNSPPDYPETDNCVSGSPLPAGQSCTITVAFQPSAKGAESGTVRIVNSAVSVATQVFLSGTGK